MLTTRYEHASRILFSLIDDNAPVPNPTQLGSDVYLVCTSSLYL